MQVLSGINMRVRKGEVHVVVGENGAGKSTLMKIISGVYQKDGGELLFEGQPVNVKSIRQMQEMGISIIHQEFNLLPNRTIAQNIFLGREPVKRLRDRHRDDERKSRELLGFWHHAGSQNPRVVTGYCAAADD